MNNEIYEKNLTALKENYIEIYDKIKEKEQELLESDRVILDRSAKGEQILAVRQGERLVYLNSRYHDEENAGRWVRQYKEKNAYHVYIIFGTSNFRHIQKLAQYVTDTNAVLVYEPDMEIFFKNLLVTDISEMICKKGLILCVRGANDSYLPEFILFTLKYSTIQITKFNCMPNYDLLYLKEWLEIVRYIKDRFNSILMSRNTEIFFAEEFVVNFLANSRDFIGQYSLNQLCKTVIQSGVNELPAIIVSAGPSLDKNIEDLKQARGKALIVGVDTSLKTLLNHDIIPDIVVTVDSHKPPILFMHTKFQNIPLVVCPQSNKELFSICSGKRFYFDEENSFLSGLNKSVTGERLQPTESGGSVANNAFSMVNVLGFRKIILVGQDLAYTGKKMHTNAAYGGTDEDMVREDGKKYFEVEDIYGEKVLTEDNMDLYRKWFEEQIRRYENLEVIDATEGGAKIKGTVIMTLREAIDHYCNQTMDIKAIIEKIPPQFDEEQQKRLYDRIDHIEDELDQIAKTIKKGIRDYEKLAELGRKNKSHTKEFKNLVKRVGELSEMIEKSPELSLVSLYNRQTEYGVLGKVYDVKEDKKEEIKDISDTGIRMLQSYLDGMKELKKDIEKTKKVEKKAFENNVNQLFDVISTIEADCREHIYSSVDKQMKDLYEYLVRAIDQIDMLIQMDNKYEKCKEFYDYLVSKLWLIVENHELRCYENLMELFEAVKEELQKIGEVYDEL